MTRQSLISPFVSIRFLLVFIFFHLCSTTDVCFSNSGEQIEFLKAGVVKISARLGNMPRFGTGIIAKIEENSIYIVTVSHVVEGDPKPFINFYKRPDHSYPSRIIGLEGDDPKGLALLVVEDDQIESSPKLVENSPRLPVLMLGDLRLGCPLDFQVPLQRVSQFG